MRRQDWLLILCVAAALTPFFIPSTGFLRGFNRLTAAFPFVMSFFKFAILATLGEMIGLRIRKGAFHEKGFGVLPRMVVWGFLGMGIALAMMVFKSGVPVVLGTVGSMPESRAETIANLNATFSGPLSWGKAGIAFAVSVAMNCIFAPVMMTLHKITDTHILQHGGTLCCLLHPIKVRNIITHLDWDTQWNLVFKKTIPLFWFPAHTVTFLLPQNLQVLFAALLGVALGTILALANNRKASAEVQQ
ncbi:MAG: hypothetical protein SPJ13_00555 [Bacteroidales bacterium]|nr:hypothetical protein [Bacteroidales bacterium]